MTARLCVLIIEDDTVVSGIYRLVLERKGFEVLTAADGEAGLELARTSHPDLVYLDVRLPKLDGMEVLRALMKDPSPPAVVMLSNYDEPPLIRSSLELGAKEYLVKVNTDPTDLATIATRWIGQRQHAVRRAD